MENKLKKEHFMLKSIGPRPTFQQDMTEEERNIMKQHVGYWTDKADKGIAIVFGPVFDPNGSYGIAIVEVDNDEQVHSLIANDPAIITRLLKTEYYPMRAVLPNK